MLKCSELNIEVWRHPRVFAVCMRKCEWWLCPYEALCDVVSELGPVGGPINITAPPPCLQATAHRGIWRC
jgi:hypothetical protein